MIKLPDPKNNLQKIERTEEYVKNAPTKSSLWETWEDKQSNLLNKNIAEKRRKGGGTFELKDTQKTY